MARAAWLAVFAALDRMASSVAALAGVAVFVAVLAVSTRPGTALPLSFVAASAGSTSTKPFSLSIVRLGQDKPASHASHLSVNSHGALELVWFSGTREGAADVEIRRSTLTPQGWSTPSSLLSRSRLQGVSARHVRKLGNPLAYSHAYSGAEQLFVTSVSLGGWAGARVEQFAQGRFVQTLPLSPFLNISTLARGRAYELQNGGFVVPVYHEFLVKAPELLVFDVQGRFVEKRRGLGPVGLLQPSLLPSESGGAHAWFRDEDSRSGRLMRSELTPTGDVAFQATNLINRDTGIDVTRLPDGRYALAFNPGLRDQLALATSQDGLTFGPATLLASEAGAEFSYPSLTMHGGQLWLSYTERRKAIAVRNIDWLVLP